MNRARRSRRILVAVLVIVTAALGTWTYSLLRAPDEKSASLIEVTSFGANPTDLQMQLFVPDEVAAEPGLLVAVHYCTGTGKALYDGAQFDELASKYGFLVIYPTANRPSHCFDVSSPEALRRDGGSDPEGIMAMVSYVQQRYSTDPSKVFVTGISSGAMMTEVLLADYPDVFAAGSAFAGVPAGCLASTDGSLWSEACGEGELIKTASQWGDLVRDASPGYTGARPRVQLWHGTDDETLSYVNFGEAIKQWTDVHGVSATPVSTDTPSSGVTRTRYGTTGDRALVEANSLEGVPHNLPVDAAAAIHFFGLDTTTPSGT